MVINLGNIKNYYLFFRYYLPFVWHVYKYWYLPALYITTVKSSKFIEYMNNQYNEKFPRIYNVYWAFKHSCDVRMPSQEYSFLYTYFDLIIQDHRPFPSWMSQTKFPSENIILGLTKLSFLVLEHKICIPDQWPVSNTQKSLEFDQKKCDVIDWLVENCSDKWNISEIFGNIHVGFVNEQDAVCFKLKWL